MLWQRRWRPALQRSPDRTFQKFREWDCPRLQPHSNTTCRHVVEIGAQPSHTSKLFKTRYALTEDLCCQRPKIVLLDAVAQYSGLCRAMSGEVANDVGGAGPMICASAVAQPLTCLLPLLLVGCCARLLSAFRLDRLHDCCELGDIHNQGLVESVLRSRRITDQAADVSSSDFTSHSPLFLRRLSDPT